MHLKLQVLYWLFSGLLIKLVSFLYFCWAEEKIDILRVIRVLLVFDFRINSKIVILLPIYSVRFLQLEDIVHIFVCTFVHIKEALLTRKKFYSAEF